MIPTQPKQKESLLSLVVHHPENQALKEQIEQKLFQLMKTAGERSGLSSTTEGKSLVHEKKTEGEFKERAYQREAYWLIVENGFRFVQPEIEYFHQFLDYLDNKQRVFTLTFDPNARG